MLKCYQPGSVIVKSMQRFFESSGGDPVQVFMSLRNTLNRKNVRIVLYEDRHCSPYEWPVVTQRFSAATTSATSWARPRHPVPRPHSPSRCCFCYAFLLLTSDGYLLYIIVNCIQTNWTINCHINWTVSSLCSQCIKFPEFQVTPGNSQTGIVSICVLNLSHKNLDILFTLFCLWLIDNCLLQFEHC